MIFTNCNKPHLSQDKQMHLSKEASDLNLQLFDDNNNETEVQSFESQNLDRSFHKENEYEIRKNFFGKCRVCDQEATGFHYGVISCEPCKVIN